MKAKQDYRLSRVRKNILNPCAVLSISTLLSPQVFAEDFELKYELPEPGFSWELTLGAGFGQIRPSLEEGSSDSVSSGSSSGSETIIRSLDNKQSSENEFSPMLNVQGSYVLSNRKTQFNFSFDEIGVSHMFDSGMELSAGIGTSVFEGEEVFRDPFVTNLPRQKQEVDSSSFNLGVSGAFGLPLQIEYSYEGYSINDDKAGASLVNNGGRFGITAEEQRLLKRSSKTHALIFSTEMPLNDSWSLMPSIGYHTTRADGAANSAKGIDLGLNALYEFDRYALEIGVNYSPSKFDHSHPVFDKTRDDKSLSYDIRFSVDEPFNWKNQRLDFGFRHFEKNSNINFYDSSESSFHAGWTFSF